MKNLLLLTTVLCSAFFANAQFTSGEKMIGGQLGLSFINTDVNSAPSAGSKVFYFRFSPSFSRFKSPMLMTGGGIYYNYQRVHSNIGDPVTERVQPSHSFGVFVNRTKLETLTKRFYFTYTGMITANYYLSHPYYTSSGGSDNWQDSYGVSTSLGIGLLYELNQRFLLTFDLSNLLYMSYQHTADKGLSTVTNAPYKNVSNSVNVGTNLVGFSLNAVGFGLKYRLKK